MMAVAYYARGGRKIPGGGRGFSLADILVPLALVVTLVAGVVLLVDGAIGSRDSAKGEWKLEREGDILLDRLEMIIRGARRIEVEVAPEAPPFTDGRYATLDLLQDLDGDPGTGGFVLEGSKGLERVLICRPGEGSQRLIARVYSSPEGSPLEVELTDLLDPEDPLAFYVEYLSDVEKGTVIKGKIHDCGGAPGIKAAGLRVSVTIREDSISRSLTRVIKFE